MGRPSKWNSPTTSIRVPEHAVEAVLSLAYHLDNQPTGVSYKKGLTEELIQLIRRHEPLLEGLDEWIDVVTSTRYQRRTLHEEVINGKYRDLAWALSGHPTNELCKGLFAYAAGYEVEPLVLLLLMELVSSINRPFGGSIHQIGKDSDAA